MPEKPCQPPGTWIKKAVKASFISRRNPVQPQGEQDVVRAASDGQSERKNTLMSLCFCRLFRKCCKVCSRCWTRIKVRAVQDSRAHGGARAHHRLPRGMGGRQRRGSGQPGFPRAVQLRHRPLQGRSAPASQRESGHPQISGFRAGLQELPYRSGHRRRQGRLGLRPQGQVRNGSHALLPGLHERTVPPHRRHH